MTETQTVYDALLTAEREGQPVVLATVIKTSGSVPRRPGSKMLVWPDGNIVGTVGGGEMESRVIEESQTLLRTGGTQTLSYTLSSIQRGDPGICGGTVELFLEAIGVLPTVVVIGCGHVGKALAELAKWSGFRVLVSDDRADLCSPEHIPDMDGYHPVPSADLAEHIPITPHTYIAAVTRGLPVDVKLFPPLLTSDAAYIGLIGSRRRWELTRQALIEGGANPETVARIRSPIGLEIGAETPEEIAISIMAEIIQVYRNRKAEQFAVLASRSVEEVEHPT